MGTEARIRDTVAGTMECDGNMPCSIVAAIIPMVKGRTNPAISLSAIISFLFFAKVAIIFLTLRGLTDNF